MKINDEICYYVEYVASDGLQHYAIHKWNDCTKFATGMRDVRFDWPTKADRRKFTNIRDLI